MAQVIGTRTTNQTITNETRQVRRVDADIALLEPSEAPLITLFNKMNKREATDNVKYEWLEDDFVARWTQNGTATVANTTASTTVTVTDGTIFVPGDLFAVPRIVSSATAPEICRVTAVTGNVLTVVRDIGGSGADTINPSAALTLIGSAYEEGATPPSAKTTAPSTLIGYTQIFRTTIDFSKTNVAMRVYGTAGSDRDRIHEKKLKEHKIFMNRALLFGQKSESMAGGPTSKPIRTTDGIIARISTNKTDASGTLNQKTFEAFSRSAFRYGKNTKILLCAPLIKSCINEWGKSYLQVKAQETVFGVKVQEVITAHGTWLVTNDWMLENGVAGQNGFGNMALSLDMEQFKYRFLSGNGQNRDTAIHMDVIKDGRDAFVDEILTEAGYQIKQEKYHAMLYNVTDWV